jgi:hypothetical protein
MKPHRNHWSFSCFNIFNSWPMILGNDQIASGKSFRAERDISWMQAVLLLIGHPWYSIVHVPWWSTLEAILQVDKSKTISSFPPPESYESIGIKINTKQLWSQEGWNEAGLARRYTLGSRGRSFHLPIPPCAKIGTRHENSYLTKTLTSSSMFGIDDTRNRLRARQTMRAERTLRPTTFRVFLVKINISTVEQELLPAQSTLARLWNSSF